MTARSIEWRWVCAALRQMGVAPVLDVASTCRSSASDVSRSLKNRNDYEQMIGAQGRWFSASLLMVWEDLSREAQRRDALRRRRVVVTEMWRLERGGRQVESRLACLMPTAGLLTHSGRSSRCPSSVRGHLTRAEAEANCLPELTSYGIRHPTS